MKSDLLYLKRYYISSRCVQNKYNNILPLKPYILISLSLCRHADIQTTQQFSFGEFSLAVRPCYTCSVFLIQFSLTEASNPWLPCAFHQPPKMTTNIQLLSLNDIAKYEKNFSSRCGLHLWLFSRMHPVLYC